MGDMMSDILEFHDRETFRCWLSEHCLTSAGVWLLFGKAGGPKTLKSYRKYFSQRRDKSKWSAKNKALVQRLEERGLMTDFGRAKIAQAKANGQWNAPSPMAVTEEQIAQVSALLEGHEPACSNFKAMSPSVQKTYARAYFDAKTDAGREKRISWMVDRVDRLNQNLKPM